MLDPGEEFPSNLIAGQHERHAPGQNNDDGHDDPVGEDAILFTTTSVNEAAARDIFGNIVASMIYP